MNRNIILAGAIAVAIAGASAVAFAGFGRSAVSNDTAAADPNRPLQTLLSQVQGQGAPAPSVIPLTSATPAVAPTQVAQAPTPATDAAPTPIAPSPVVDAIPTVTPGADTPAATPAPEQAAAPQSKFVPTAAPMPRNQPQRTRIVRQVASGAMCN